VAPIGSAVAFVTLRLAVTVGLVVDPLLFPALRHTRVQRPVFIVGNPRSGTTFLHRFMHSRDMGAGVPLWGMLFPSLALRAVVRPFLPILERMSPARYHQTSAHHTSLESVETDDVALLFRYFDGFFLYGFLLAWDVEERKQLVDPRIRDYSARDFAWLRKIWRRNLVFTGHDRVIAKLFSAGPRLGELLQHFPDGQVLYMVRDPVQTIPSTLSLVSGVLDARFGFWSLAAPVRQRWVDRLYEGLVELMRRFHDGWTDGTIPQERVMIVPFQRLMQDFEGLMEEMAEFLDLDLDDALRAEVAAVGAQQRAYKSEHGYDLARFGLDEDRIRHDCAFMYEAFLGNP
jgi:hypothetical protein